MDPVLDTFTEAYVAAMLWSTNDESTPDGGEPFDRNYGPEDLAPLALRDIIHDCKIFQVACRPMIEYDLSQAGYDFWLTRAGHGCGFWDGDWPADGDRLTEIATAFGECNLELGDDRNIHLC